MELAPQGTREGSKWTRQERVGNASGTRHPVTRQERVGECCSGRWRRWSSRADHRWTNGSGKVWNMAPQGTREGSKWTRQERVGNASGMRNPVTRRERVIQ